MRRKDRERDQEFAFMVVDKCEYAVLSMVDQKGKPYCIPISIVRENENIYFHCAKDGKKVELMRKCPNVCMTFVGNTYREKDKFTTKYESAIAYGIAQEVYLEEEKVIALRMLCERHTPTNMENFEKEIAKSLSKTAVWKVTIDSITGKYKE